MRDLALEAYVARWQPAARHDLSASDSETLSLSELIDGADAEDQRRWEELRFGYTDPHGAVGLREAIAGTYRSVSAELVTCFAGAQEAIFATMHGLLQADEHAIVVTPNYQSMETVPLGLCPVTGVALDPTRSWSLDIDQVAAAIRPNTRLVAINFPNNPTGKILERDRFDALAALCRRHGLWLFSDEIYRLIERDPASRLPAAVDAYERGISLGGTSKSYGLPGLRIGWIACRDRQVLRTVGRVKHYLSTCNAAPCELLAEIAIKAGDRILRRNRLLADRNLTLLNGFFAEHRAVFDWYLPDGGVVGYPRYRGAEGVEEFCTRLVQRHGVLLLPASIYRSEITPTPADRFRVGFGRSAFPAGLAAMAEGLSGVRCEARIE